MLTNRSGILAVSGLVLIVGISALREATPQAAGQVVPGRIRPGQPARPGAGIPRGRPAEPADSAYCRLVRYEPLEWSEEGDPIGFIMARPARYGGKVRRLFISSEYRPTFSIPADPENDETYDDLLVNGLYCTLHWRDDPNDEKARRPAKIVTRIELDRVEVEGEIRKLEDDVVQMRVRPVGGAPWPHLVAKARAGANTQSDAARARLSRPLIVSAYALPEITQLRDENGPVMDLMDLHERQSIRATLVVGVPRGLLISMTAVKPTAPGEGGLDAPGRPGGG